MSGPIVPPLTVSDEADGGSVSGRPITTIEVTSGTLTVSGRVATLDTSGSGGSPGTPAKSIQFNSDPAGTFTGSDRLLFDTAANNGQILIKSGASATQAEIRAVDGRGIQIGATDTDSSIRNQIVLFGENDAPDGILLIPNTGENVTLQTGGLTTSASDGDLVLSTYGDEDKAKITLTAGADGDILVQTDNTGVLQLENTTTDADSVLSIMGNGTGDAKLDLQNASKRVWVLCDDNKKLKIQGGAAGNTFVFDVTSATGGITFPDATTLISAEGTAILATGVTDGYVLTADGAGASAWEAAGGGGATELSGLSDVLIDATNFTDGFLIQTNSGGSAPTTGTLSAADNNLGIGSDCLAALTSGFGSVALGEGSMRGLTSGSDNIAIGGQVMYASDQGTYYRNIGIGFQTLTAIEDGTNENIGIGYKCLRVLSTGNSNVCMGYIAGNNITTGNKNTAIGADSGQVTTGNYNTTLGYGGFISATADNQLEITTNSTIGTFFWIQGDSAGSCYQGDNAATWSTTSDQRLKREIVDATVGLDAINAVQVRNFRYIEKAERIMETTTDDEGVEHQRVVGYDGDNRYNLDPEPLQVGVIAQEIQEVFPDAVKENVHGHLTVHPDSINWALLKAVQELSAKVEALEASQ